MEQETIQQPLPTTEELIKVPVDALKQLYYIMKERMISEEEAIENDWTNLFWYNLTDKIKNGELIRILIRGEVRTGKSTVGLKIKHEINKTLYALKKTTHKIDEVSTILSDQTEFIRFAMQKLKHMCVQIDEYSALAEGGANASTEEQIYQAYSEMFASRYIHVINCNPTRITDTNSFIHLEVIGKGQNEQGERFTRCKLMYCNNIDNDILTLGHIDVHVWDIIKNWETNVRPIFEQQTRTQQENELIKKEAQKDWFVKYQIKKEKRQDLLQINHVRDVRDLEFSDVVLGTYQELYDIAETDKVDTDVIVATIQDQCIEKGRIYSMYAEITVMNKVKALLTLTRQKEKYATAIEMYERLKENPKSKTKKTPKQIEKLLKAKRKFEELFQRRYKAQKKMLAVYEEYNKINGENW